jgi:hypothetical protein
VGETGAGPTGVAHEEHRRMAAPTSSARRGRRVVPLWVLTGLALTAALALAGPAHAAGEPDQGWLRLAHLSPDQPPLDVYVYRAGAVQPTTVRRHVDYGTVSPYQQLAAGQYTVAMRGDGAPPDSPPLLSSAVTVRPDDAYTVASVGDGAHQGLTVLHDQLTSPGSGSSVRVIEASRRNPVASVSLVGGPSLTERLGFPAASPYRNAPAGRWTVQVTGARDTAHRRLSFAAGSIHTLVVVDRPAGDLGLLDLTDAAGASAVPSGGVDAGLGGLARPGRAMPSSGVLAPVLIWTVPAAVVAGGLILLGTRRARSRTRG